MYGSHFWASYTGDMHANWMVKTNNSIKIEGGRYMLYGIQEFGIGIVTMETGIVNAQIPGRPDCGWIRGSWSSRDLKPCFSDHSVV